MTLKIGIIGPLQCLSCVWQVLNAGSPCLQVAMETQQDALGVAVKVEQRSDQRLQTGQLIDLKQENRKSAAAQRPDIRKRCILIKLNLLISMHNYDFSMAACVSRCFHLLLVKSWFWCLATWTSLKFKTYLYWIPSLTRDNNRHSLLLCSHVVLVYRHHINQWERSTLEHLDAAMVTLARN